MNARAIWKATVVCGRRAVPVKMYSAVKDQSIRFHLLHDQDFVRVEQRMVNPQNDKAVPYEAQLRGYEISRGVFVKLDAEELASLEPAAGRDIELTQFVSPDAIDRARYLRPYWLGPDSDDEAYFALVAAIGESESVGIARWVMRKKSYIGALTVSDEHLLLTTLRSDEETIRQDELAPPGGRELSKQERQLAQQLVTALADDFDTTKFHDEYRARIAALIEAKRRGETIEIEEYEPKPQSDSLLTSLKSSLQKLK
jgi:DNA end-binding protein Ku